MFIEQAYNKRFDFAKYIPVPAVFLILMVLNYVATLLLPVKVDELMREQVADKGENRVLFELLLPFAIFLSLLLLYVKFVHKQTIKSLTTARKKVDWGRIFFAFGLWATITVAMTAIAYYSKPDNYELNFKPVPFAILAAISIILIPVQTSFEEYLFRGYLMQGIGVATRSRLAPLIITSVVFGLMHAANPEVEKLGFVLLFYYIGTGFFLGIITLMDDGMELALGFHAANNLIGALLITSDWTAFQTNSILKDHSEPSAGIEIFVPIVVLFPLLIFIFKRKYHWTGWREKLSGKVTLYLNQNNETGHTHE